MTGRSHFWLILSLALRNLWAYRLRTVILAALLGVGAFLALVGLSLLEDISRTMRSSITDSVAGELQLYSSKAKDPLQIFGSMFMGRSDVGVVEDLATVRSLVMEHPNVRAMIPMGVDMALLSRGNELDEATEALRDSLSRGDAATLQDRVDALRFAMEYLVLELQEQKRIGRDSLEVDKQMSDLQAALHPTFLSSLVKSRDEQMLQFLETKIAPLSGEKQPVYLMYVGTDIELFRNNFQKFKVVEGEGLRQGERGILIAQKTREDMLKIMPARILDRLYKRTQKSGIPLRGDPENERLAADLPRQYGPILAQLTRDGAMVLSRKLTDLGFAPESGGSTLEQIKGQIIAFLTLDETQIARRRDWFYENVAPLLRMYEIMPGETLILRSYTRSGYVKNVPLRVRGVYTFDGLEDADLAGALSIIDLVSFRELFGHMSDAARAELATLRESLGLKTLARDAAEEALFGDSAASQEPAAASRTWQLPSQSREGRDIRTSETFDPQEVRQGLALNIALRLHDPRNIADTRRELELKISQQGLPFQIIDWREAAGIAGQFVVIVRAILILSLVIIFAVALVIINNSVLVSTLGRSREIGTMRAMGAQRSFVLSLFLTEIGLTGLLGSVTGASAGALLIIFLGKSGIPAPHDVVAFLFAGPRLFPTFHPLISSGTPMGVTLVATVATLYAARHAAKIRPVEAMQEKE